MTYHDEGRESIVFTVNARASWCVATLLGE